MRSVASVLAVAVALAVSGQVAGQEPAPELSTPGAQVLVLGVFHFRDGGLDEYKPRHDIDILSGKRQAEVEDLVEHLASFQPTKVAVERREEHRDRIDTDFTLYREGRFELRAHEVHQLGFRLAAKLGHEFVHPVDVSGRTYDPWVDPDTYARDHGQSEALNPLRYMEYDRVARYEDELKTSQTLREHLLYLNDPGRLLRSHGQYLIGSFKAGSGNDYPGVDAKTAWYNRNLRIFANLQRLAERPGERILLIIGSGHAPILRHAIAASPEFELIEAASVLDPTARDL